MDLDKTLREIDPLEFERLVMRLWSEMGWNTRVTKASRDGGVDVIAQRDSPYPERHGIQVKR
jgi:HJR/Mrr/RecB family endonuclease